MDFIKGEETVQIDPSGINISSLTNKINGSINPCKPLGSIFFLEYDLDTVPIIKNNRKTDINIDATFLFIYNSIISRPPSSII